MIVSSSRWQTEKEMQKGGGRTERKATRRGDGGGDGGGAGGRVAHGGVKRQGRN